MRNQDQLSPNPAQNSTVTTASETLRANNYADSATYFLPPHPSVLCNEDREAFARLRESLIKAYRPPSSFALSIVEEIADAQWQIQRLKLCLTMQWNLAIVKAAGQQPTLAAELVEIQTIASACNEVYANNAGALRLNRQIDQLVLRVTRLERRLKFTQTNFPINVGNLSTQTQPQPGGETSSTVETNDVDPGPIETIDESKPPIFVTENNPLVIEAYRHEFPGRRIVVLPPDDVAKGLDIDDSMTSAPRHVI